MSKALVWDIETAPMVATTWSLYPKALSPDNIMRDWYIISGAWKWLGGKRVYSAAIDPKAAQAYLAGEGPPPDREVVERLRAAVCEADFIIAHNGDAFDTKKLNARVIFHGLEAMPRVRSVDTLREARKVAKFSSNRLAYLSKHLGQEGKISTEYGLWLRVMHGDRAALKEMLDYNKRDVTELEEFYLMMRPYMDAHPNVVLERIKSKPIDPENPVCPRCGSTHVQRRGTAKTLTQVYSRFHCQDCGSWSRASTIKGGILR